MEQQVQAVEKELHVLGGRLGPLEAKPLGDRMPDEKDEIKRLSKKEKQLRTKEEQLRDEKKRLYEKATQLRKNDLQQKTMVPLISGPSSVSVSDVDAFCLNGSLLSSEAYLDACKVFSASVADSPTGSAVMEVLRLCERRSTSGGPLEPQLKLGLFDESDGAAQLECLFSGVLCATLAARRSRVGDREARWLHRIPERARGEVDVQLCVLSGAITWLPVMVMEVGLRQRKNQKHPQASAYAINVSSQMGVGHVLLVAEMILHPSDQVDAFAWLTVTGCHVEGRRLVRVPLWEGPLSDTSMERFLKACDAVAAWNTREGRATAWRCVNANVAVSAERVFKVFDYRGRDNVAPAERRCADLSVLFIPDCEKVISAQDLVVISYPRLEGSHTAHTVRHFASLIASVSRLHRDGVVHGDIRASNIVFTEGGQAQLIDFDYSGDTNRTYPKGFNRKIEDGKRARGARAGARLSFEHDWFAVAALMRMANVLDGAFRSLWNDACVHVNDERPVEALKLLDEVLEVELAQVDGKDSNCDDKGTGSPPRDGQ